MLSLEMGHEGDKKSVRGGVQGEKRVLVIKRV